MAERVVDLERLEALARAACNTGWDYAAGHILSLNELFERLYDKDDVAFIVAASPDTILALIAEIRRLEGEVERLAENYLRAKEELGELRHDYAKLDALRAELEADRDRHKKALQWAIAALAPGEGVRFEVEAK